QDILAKIEIENKIKEGATTLLQVLDSKKINGQEPDPNQVIKQVESELQASKAKIALLHSQLEQNAVSNLPLTIPPQDVSAVSGLPTTAKPTIKITDSFTPISSGPDSLPNSNSIASSPESESPTWSLGAILQSLEDPTRSPDFLIQRANDLVNLLMRHPLLKYDLVIAAFGDRVQKLLLHQKTEVIASGYRMARHAITDLASLKIMRQLHTDFFVVRTLAKDAKYNLERQQALKYIRMFLDIPSGIDQLSLQVVRGLVAIAEQTGTEDKLKNLALETLAEILILKPELVAEANGVRPLLQTIVEGPYLFSLAIAKSVVCILDSPHTRHILRYGEDLLGLIAPFTETQVRTHVNTDKLINCSSVLLAILNTWAGLTGFSHNNFHALRILLDCLRVPIPQLRDIILDLLFDLFRLDRPQYQPKKDDANGIYKLCVASFDNPSTDSTAAGDCRFVNHYTALLLLVFLKCGLANQLTGIIEDKQDEKNYQKAIILLSEIHRLAAKFLPPSHDLTEILTLPRLLNCAINGERDLSGARRSMCKRIDIVDGHTHLGIHGHVHTHSIGSVGGTAMTDMQFRQLIIDTQVLTTKNFSKWNWDVLIELIEGPLLNPKRLDEAIKSTKFMKRLMSFYRPFKYRYSSIKQSPASQKYVTVGSALLRTFLANDDGVKYLMENKLLRQIAECLAQLDPMSGITSAEPLFSEQRLENTLTSGYFTLLGILSGDINGLAMMERWRMFNMIYHISEIAVRDDLIMIFIAAMDYTLQGHHRIILSKALTTGTKAVRVFATRHIKKLLDDPVINSATKRWAVQLLVQQLYDPQLEVCQMAISLLEEYCCNNSEHIDHVISCQPALEHLGEIGIPLLVRFLFTSTGFKYLNDLHYIENEMDYWIQGLNERYVTRIENYLESVYTFYTGPASGSATSIFSSLPARSSAPPSHFYGELVMTDEGCMLLSQKDHISQFVNFVRMHRDETKSPTIIKKLKGCLWALGFIGSTHLGSPFLETHDDNDTSDSGSTSPVLSSPSVVADIVYLAENSPVASVRGTAFFVLGLVSSTILGLELLDEFRWTTSLLITGEPKGLGVCQNIDVLFNNNNEELAASKSMPLITAWIPTTTDPIKTQILTALSNLSNQVLANEASLTLVKLEARYTDRFQNVDLFMETMRILERFRYRQLMRRFIFELFDFNRILTKMVRKSRENRKRRSHSD
ncbi:hypothetical protein NADFUDRAFT_8425, partial [Nadsonia fulvescens var. elongata DSM 6958]